MAETTCNHIRLNLLGGALHPGGKDYMCSNCGEQCRVEILKIGVHFGTQEQPNELRTDSAARERSLLEKLEGLLGRMEKLEYNEDVCYELRALIATQRGN